VPGGRAAILEVIFSIVGDFGGFVVQRGFGGAIEEEEGDQVEERENNE
jgi:hypothetical protein